MNEKDLLDTIEMMLRAAAPNGAALTLEELQKEVEAHSNKPSEYITYRLEQEMNEVYCKTCGSCGEAGCCSPDNCIAVKCLYVEANKRSYQDMFNSFEAIYALLEEIKKENSATNIHALIEGFQNGKVV